MAGLFDFLPEDMAYYANIAVEQVDRYPTSSLNSIRSFADLAARLIAECHSIATIEGVQKTQSRFRDTNDIYQDIESYLEASGRKFFIHVFKHANPSSHGQSDITSNIAEVYSQAQIAIQLAEPFGRWLCSRYVGSAGGFAEFFEGLLDRVKVFAIVAGIIFFIGAVFVALRSPDRNTTKAALSAVPSISPPPRYERRAIPTISQIQIGRRMTAGKLDAPGDRFMAPVSSVAAVVSYANAVPSQTKLKVVLAVGSQLHACEEQIASYSSGTISCEWQEQVPPGEYSVYAYADTSSQGRRFLVTAPPNVLFTPSANSSVPSPAPTTPRQPVLTELRRIQLDVVPYIPQHIIFDDADQMAISDHRGVAVLLDGRVVDPCTSGGRQFTATQYGMYTFDSCGNTRITLVVVKYIKR